MMLAQELLLYDRPREAAELAIANARGSLELVVIESGPNAYGEHALGYGGQRHADLDLPNPAFFRHVDWVVKRATSKGLQVKLLAPGPESVFSEEKRAEFLRYLRKRYERNRRVVVSVQAR